MAELTILPDYTYEITDKYSVLVSSFEKGAEQRRLKRKGKKSSYRLVYLNRPKSEFATFRAFFDARYGSYETFTWGCLLDGADRTVRFDADSLSYKWQSFNSVNWSVDVKTVSVEIPT